MTLSGTVLSVQVGRPAPLAWLAAAWRAPLEALAARGGATPADTSGLEKA